MTSLWLKSTPVFAALLVALQPSLAFGADAPAVPGAPVPAAASPAVLPAPPAESAAPAVDPAHAAPQNSPETAAPAEAANAPKRPAQGETFSVFRRARPPTLPASRAHRDAGPAVEESNDDGTLGSHQKHFYGMLGYRGTRVTGDGYQPFSNDQGFHQASVVFGRVLFADDALSFALGLAWDYGASSAEARGASTTLEAQRFTLLPELRYHLVRRLYAFGRLGAGLAPVHAELSDSVTESSRTSDRLAFTLDSSLGLAFEVFGEPAGASRQPRVWLALDGGYVFSATTKTVLENESGVPARSEPYAFADLNLSGLSGRLSAALTF